MKLVWTAIVLLAALGMLNLLLALGIIRRLREQADATGQRAPRRLRLEVGERVGEFSAVSTGGAPVSRSSLHGSVVAVLSATCAPCKALLPDFLEFAAAFPGGAGRILAVATGEAAEVAELIEQLEPVARVVTERMGGPVCAALGVSGFPSLLLVGDDGTVESSGGSMDVVRAPVARPVAAL
ncbi:TlpA family protein disulfide reductase [Actinospica robiniae]|uniref:TlpA family protein disulfide reductase n=1 Tax=Actinospica robiniae TaxID=304901 RepID=UPI0004209BD7|nr:TlpA disulfide reductase family protein [Actinospica robiniae]